MSIENSPPDEWKDETWILVLTSVVSLTAMPYEDSKDIVAGAWSLGQRRAELLDRPFWPGEDVVHPLCIFCWWPFKPAISEDSKRYTRDLRWELFKDVSSSKMELRRLQAAVPDELLRMDTQQLFNLLREEPAWNFIHLHEPTG